MIKVFWSNIVFIVLLLSSCTSILSSSVYNASDPVQGRWPEPLTLHFHDAGSNTAFTAPLGLWYQAKAGDSWYWQQIGDINTSYAADLYRVDLFESSIAFIDKLHHKERRVICQFAIGKYTSSVADAKNFPLTDLGKPLDDSSDEFWIDIRSEDIKKIMQGRLKLATHKNCDGVQFDYVEIYKNDTGFPISLTNQKSYNDFLIDQAHQHGLGVGVKNNAGQVITNFDIIANGQYQMGVGANINIGNINIGKLVTDTEYSVNFELVYPSTLDDGSFCFTCKSSWPPYINLNEYLDYLFP